jgi:thymidine phosphorylase
MSKKMAEGIDALVLDVKTGDGAFMKTFEDSRALAQAMVDIGRGMGKKIAALITDMDQPLGHAIGNSLEVSECIETLKGRGPRDLEELSVELAAWMLHLAADEPLDAARDRIRKALASGEGLKKFRDVIERQGGDPAVCEDTGRLPRARRTVDIHAGASGHVTRIACAAVGHAAMVLGAGRETVDSAIDPAVGLILHKKVGDAVAGGEPLATLHVNDTAREEDAIALIRSAIKIGPAAPPGTKLVRLVIQ